MPHLDVLEALARVLPVSPGWLAYGQGEESAAPGADAPPLHPGVAGRLRGRREAAGLSVRALSRAAGCSDTAVRTIETGQVSPGVDTAERLADALALSPAWLAFGEGEAEVRPRRGRTPSPGRAPQR